jgi:HEAT repeat protein
MKMGISLEEQNGGWDTSAAGHGGVYDLVSAAMNARSTEERIRAVEALGKSDDPRAVRPLVDLLADKVTEVRLCATASLGHLKSGRPVDDLIDKLRDREETPAIRRQAAVSLAAIRSTGAIRGLRDFAVDEDEDSGLRREAENLLTGIDTW